MKVIFFTMAYNAEKTLPGAIDSVLGQSVTDLEYFVLDNGSDDHTWDIIKEYASRDRRIVPLSIEKNDPAHGGLLFCMLSYASDADYLAWLDADDTYSPDFLEKMIPFAEENRLDIASCGYDSIDGLTGKLLKHRAAPEHIILEGNGFADRFVDYRGFTMFFWGKLYSVPFLKRSLKNHYYKYTYDMYSDSIRTQALFQDADRAGIYREALYQYYQYPNSLSRIDPKDNIAGCRRYLCSARNYLTHYGPLSRVNEDFLYAIYLSMTDGTANEICSSNLPVAEKLELLRMIFAEPLWAETLAREADPQFRNLADRAEYVERMKDCILTLPVTPEEQRLAEAAIRELDKPLAGADKPAR